MKFVRINVVKCNDIFNLVTYTLELDTKILAWAPVVGNVHVSFTKDVK